MTDNDRESGQTLLAQFTTAYLRYRWLIGTGIIGVTVIVMLLGASRPYLWVLAAAGLFILVHALASGAWRVTEPVSALVVDITVANVAMLIFDASNRDSTGAKLTLVVAALLIVLLTDGWRRVVLLAYSSVFAVVIMLAAASWDVSLILGDGVALVFIVCVVTGVISSIKNRLYELEAARAQTLGVVSHELRNHMTGVIGLTQVIVDPNRDFDSAELKELLGLANQQAVEAGEVIEDLLTASRAERGVLDVASKAVDLCHEAETVLRRFCFEGRTIPLDCTDGPVWANADPDRVRQVLRNLITNADRYGGPDLTVSVVGVGPIASVVVSDDGAGVHPADEHSIFLPYRRSRSQEPAPGSTGLGLWIARSLTRKMGGDLTYQRRSGRTLFEVTLPSAEAPASGQTPVLAALPSVGHGSELARPA